MLHNSIFNLYDANGNMTADLNKGVTLTYNRLNLPLQAAFPYRRSTALRRHHQVVGHHGPAPNVGNYSINS